MPLRHGWHAAFLAGLLFCTNAANAAPQRVVSTFLCTDEYVFRLVPRGHIAALSFLARDEHPVVATIHDQTKGMPLTRASAEEVLALHPDMVVMYQGTNPRLKAHLIATHIPFVEVPWANSLNDIRDITRKLGDELGARGTADAMIADMDRKLADARAGAA